MKLLVYVFCVSLYAFSVKADDMQGAFRDLGQHYYKGSKFEEQVSTYYSKLPIQLQTTLSYFPYLQQIFVEQKISIVLTFP